MELSNHSWYPHSDDLDPWAYVYLPGAMWCRRTRIWSRTQQHQVQGAQRAPGQCGPQLLDGHNIISGENNWSNPNPQFIADLF